MGMAFGLIVASVTTKYRDLIHLMDFGMQLWLYGTPVAYGLSMIPESYYPLYMLNPVTMVIVVFRYAFFGTGYFDIGYYGLSWAVTLLALTLARACSEGGKVRNGYDLRWRLWTNRSLHSKMFLSSTG